MDLNKIYKEWIRSNNPKLFNSLFEALYPQLVVFGMKFLKDMDLSKELVQDLFVKLYENGNKINIETSIKSYLFRSVHNAALNIIKSQNTHNQHHKIILQTQTEETNHVNEYIQATELELEIHNVVNQLPEKCKQIFTMSRFDNKSNQEIAEELNLSKRTVETQISNALKTLRNKLSNYLN